MRLFPAVALTLVLLLASPATAAGPASFHPAASSSSAGASTTDLEMPDRADPWQVIRINVTEDGDAEWAVESRYALDSERDAAAFEDFAEAVAAGEADVNFDVEAVERFADRAAEETGREMAIEDTGWAEPRIEPENATPSPENDTVGVISKTFTWENFAEVDGPLLSLGDALHVDGQPLFDSLDDGQHLVIDRPENYGYDDFPNSATQNEERALVWEGPHDFETGEIRVTYFERATGDEEHELTATIEDEEGTPLEGATVTLVGLDDPLTAETGVDGRITFEELPDGEYTIGVEYDGAETDAAVTIDGGDETVSLALEVPEPEPEPEPEPDETHALTATIEDEEGTPLEGATVTLEGPDGEERTAETDADGRVTFEELPDGEYAIAVEYDGAETDAAVTIAGGDETVSLAPEPVDEGDSETGSGSLLLTALGLAGAVALLGATTYVVGKRREPADDGVDDPANAAAETDAANDSTTIAYDEAPLDPADDEEEIDVELLSDEERVLRLLRKNNGRMKQATIVAETGWSDAKVSQLLSKMNDDEEIEKLRIGRENLITLPEVDPTEIG